MFKSTEELHSFGSEQFIKHAVFVRFV